MRVPRPAGDTAWKCAGFRAPMAAIRSGKAGFSEGIYLHVHHPEGRALAGPAARCTCVYTAIEAGMRVPRPAGDTAWKCAGFRAPMAAIRSGKAGFSGHLLACTPPGRANPSWPCGPMYMRLHGHRGRYAGSTACVTAMRQIFWPPTAAIGSGKAGFSGGIYSHVHHPEGRTPAGPAARCTCVYTAIEAGMRVPRPA
jgi:hypothetical protein